MHLLYPLLLYYRVCDTVQNYISCYVMLYDTLPYDTVRSFTTLYNILSGYIRNNILVCYILLYCILF